MRKTGALFVVLTVAFCFAVQAASESPPTDRPYAVGVVVDEYGKPVAGVQYWSNGFRLGENGDRGRVSYTGGRKVEVTGEDGRFRAAYGGAGREEQAVDVSFQLEDFAPAFLVNANEKNGPYTVKLEKGIKLSGTLEGSPAHPNEQHLWPGKVRLHLDVIHKDVGGFATRIPIETQNDGWFSTRIPSDHWNCVYILDFAGKETKLEFDQDTPLPQLRIVTAVEVEQVRRNATSNAEQPGGRFAWLKKRSKSQD